MAVRTGETILNHGVTTMLGVTANNNDNDTAMMKSGTAI